MIAYQYDTDGFLIGEVNCQLDPLESTPTMPIYLLPAGSTFFEPPSVPEGMEAKFDFIRSWELVEKRKPVELPGPDPVPELTPEQKALYKGLASQNVGSQVVAMVYAINESKSISSAAMQELLSDPQIATIERLLWAGALATARDLILSLDSTYFTETEKGSIVSFIDSFLRQDN